MRALMLEVPEDLLEQRRKMGGDRRDEMWDGVLHMVPSPTWEHQRYNEDLYAPLKARARAKGLEWFTETDLHRPEAQGKDYRQPDIVFVQPELVIPGRRIEGRAEFLVEVLSPNDESHEKLPFYEKLGCREALYVDPKTCAFEFFALKGKKLALVKPRAGVVRSKVLAVSFATRKGPKLEITWKGGEAFVAPFVPRRKK